MRYISTRGQVEPVGGAQAILQGLAPDGGLFVPEQIPALPADFITQLTPMDYPQRAAFVLSLFLPEFDGLEDVCREAYRRFDGPPAPLVKYGADAPFFLELFHGPTCAFKDMALQVLPRLVSQAKALTGETRDVYILTATSGDTGKAALEGFFDIPGTRVLVFYPEQGVSEIQELQMVTQEGGNVAVCAVKGDFDDAQAGVKRFFSFFSAKEREQKVLLTSANSINLGRLLPQVAYYVSAYVDWRIATGNGDGGPAVVVPTGNFGNILAAMIAKRMGVPFGRLVCASNKNHVLTDVIQTGVYDRNRALVRTDSPSMDILVSSNFERALWLLSGCDGAYIKDCMERLASDGRYALRKGTADALKAEFDAFRYGNEEGRACIRRVFEETGKILDPHTAVAAAGVYGNPLYRDCIVVATAHPGKFPEAVLDALPEGVTIDMPQALRDVRQKPRRFTSSVAPDGIEGFIREWLM